MKRGRVIYRLGACVLLILFLFKLSDYRKEEERRIPNVTPPTANFSWTCQKNTTAANVTDFGKLHPLIQDFLYYQHCRNFPLLLDLPYKCKGAANSLDVFLLLVIKTSPPNYERRDTLRKTWARERRHSGLWIKRVFLSGTSSAGFDKKRLNELLQIEQQQHGDILQWDFRDTFYNLTLKQMLFLEWMEERCPNARFLLNGDDDVFAHTDNMVEYLKSLIDQKDKHLFAGHLIHDVGPIRIPESKYYIPKQVYESESYPPYCGGGGFLLSGHTAMVIRQMSKVVPFLPIDDVYMGMCLAKAGLRPVSHMGVKTAGLQVPSKKYDKYDPCFYKEILLVHRFLPADMYVMWHRIKNPKLSCGAPHWETSGNNSRARAAAGAL